MNIPHPRSKESAAFKPIVPHTASIFDIWLQSRTFGPEGEYLIPGASRRICRKTVQQATTILKHSAPSLVYQLFHLHPTRTTVLFFLNISRHLFPAFRGYSHALIIDEIQRLLLSGDFSWTGIIWLIASEILRRVVEGYIEALITVNEGIVLQTIKFHVEQQQLQQRLKMDGPTLEDPVIRDLFQESDMFIRSFSGGGFGLLSPLDFMQIFGLIAEILSYTWLVYSMTNTRTHFGILLLTLASAILPSLLPAWVGPNYDFDSPNYSLEEVTASNRQEKMWNLAYNHAHRSEVALFGLGPWILRTWTNARLEVLELEQDRTKRVQFPSIGGNFSDFIFAAQNLPYVLLIQSTATGLGALTLYRTSISSLTFALRTLSSMLRMAFQSTFLIGAFSASMQLQPKLDPPEDDYVPFQTHPMGIKIEARNLSYTYPGALKPALDNINFTIEAGQSFAIVGVNGSGKTTLSMILLRLIDFNGELEINGIDIRRYKPSEYHQHITGVLQNFSKWNSTVHENVGLGQIEWIEDPSKVGQALKLAEAETVVASLPSGVRTVLEPPGFEGLVYPGSMNARYPSLHHGLSGGEWQRIAIARAFMRLENPNVGLVVLDEATSSLDAHAQRRISDTVFGPTAARKTVIVITHRINTARRADRVAVMEHGRIEEFGSPEELKKKNGAFADMLKASSC